MAMTREQQRAAADRIAAKFPMDEESKRIYKRITATPENYNHHADKRICPDCGAEFSDVYDSKGVLQLTMLEQFTDHMASHNPSPAQWATAHQKIQDGSASQKGRTPDQSTDRDVPAATAHEVGK